MDAIRIKKDFHNLIDSFSDTNLLEEFYEIINSYSQRKKDVDILDELTDEQRTRLHESIKQVQNGEIIEHQQVKANLKKWLEE